MGFSAYWVAYQELWDNTLCLSKRSMKDQITFFWCLHKWSYSYTLNLCWLGKQEMWNSFIFWPRKPWLFYISFKTACKFCQIKLSLSVHNEAQLKVKGHYQHSAWPDVLLSPIHKFFRYSFSIFQVIAGDSFENCFATTWLKLPFPLFYCSFLTTFPATTTLYSPISQSFTNSFLAAFLASNHHQS